MKYAYEWGLRTCIAGGKQHLKVADRNCVITVEQGLKKIGYQIVSSSKNKEGRKKQTDKDKGLDLVCGEVSQAGSHEARDSRHMVIQRQPCSRLYIIYL